MFKLSESRFALNLPTVEKVVRAVEITRLPKAPEIVLGVVNVHGRIVPVIDGRARFGFPKKKISLNDRFVIARGEERSIALVADDVMPVVEVPEERITRADDIIPGIGYVDGVTEFEESNLVILTVEQILSLEESTQLDEAIEEMQAETEKDD
jgi:purine-binding chemotaxis protein CheW